MTGPQSTEPPPSPGATPFTAKQYLALAAITLVAAVLRLHQLGEWSLWVDEAHTYRDVVAPSAEFFDSNVSNYPLSYLLLRGLIAMGMSTSEGWMRLPFAFFGILSVPALALVGRGMVGPKAAIIGAVLLTISPWHLYWSQNARSYSMVLFFVLLAAGGFFSGVRRRAPWLMVWTVVLTVIAGLCHPSAYVFLGSFVVYGLLSPRRGWMARHKWFPLMIMAVLVAVVVVLLPLVENWRRVKPDFSVLHLVHTLVFFVSVPLLVAGVGGLLLLFDEGRPGATYLLSWVVVPMLALAILGSGVAQVTAQYAFYTLPAFCLLAASLVHELAQRVGSERFRGHLLRSVPLLLLLLDLGGGSYLYFMRQYGDRPRWREAKEFIVRQPGTQTVVLTTNQPSMSYYLDPYAFHGSSEGSYQVRGLADFMLQQAGGGDKFMAAQVAEARRDGYQLFVVLTPPELEEMDWQRRADTYLRHNFRQVRRLPNWIGPKDMTVLVYQLRE